MFRDNNVGVFWNEGSEQPEMIVDRQHWTEMFVQWSPLGTYLLSMHAQGIQLWGGKSWGRQKRFAHPGCNLVDFSPSEKYVCTWSHRPISVDENHPVLSADDDGNNYIIWDIATGKPLRSFKTLDMPTVAQDEAGQPIKKKLQWPAFKWSADDNFVARMTPGQSISVYELPSMRLLDKHAVKIESVQDFDWCPTTVKRDGVKTHEQLFCYWTPEIGNNPAKVGLMSIPSKEIVRTRNLFNVSDAKLHWQSDGQYLCVKVDRHSKSKKSMATNLEIFRITEKNIPVEVVDSLKDTVINFAWEPKGDRFVIITAGEIVPGAAVPPKTSVSFFCPEKAKGNTPGNFKHIRTFDKKNSNAIYWSPKGRFVVVATVHSQQNFELDFWDLDYEGEKDEAFKDLTANLQLMNTVEHYGITDLEWDPTGRYVASVASFWKHQVRIDAGFENYNANHKHRPRTATICMTSRAPLCAKNTSTASSSSPGDPAQQPSSQRKSKRRCARTCASGPRSSMRQTTTRRMRRIGLWLSIGGDCWRSGRHGVRRLWRSCGRMLWRLVGWQVRNLRMVKVQRLLRRWLRRSLRRPRRSLSSCVVLIHSTYPYHDDAERWTRECRLHYVAWKHRALYTTEDSSTKQKGILHS